MSKKTKKLSAMLSDLFSGDYTEMYGVEVLNGYPNTYGLEFSEQDLEDYVDNTNHVISKGYVKPNVKMSHSDQQLLLKELFKMSGLADADIDMWEELPNLGLLENFRRKGKSVYADIKQIPSKLKDIVFSGGLFTSLSPELVRNWRETGKNIIRAIALSNIPSMKHVTDVPMSQGLSFGGNIILTEGGHEMGDENKNKDTITVDVLDEKIAKNNEGLITKFSEMIKGLVKGKDDKTPPVKTGNEEKVISLSEVQTMLSEQAEKFTQQINDVNQKLIDKDKEVKLLSENNKQDKLKSKKAETEAICKKAGMEGVPPYVINLFKPILMSEAGEQVIKFSEKVDDEMIETEKPVSKFIQDLFDNYPSKVSMTEMTQTFLSDEAVSEDKKINQTVNDLMTQNPGMSKFDALMKAGEQVRQ